MLDRNLDKLVLASGNAGKLKEFGAIFADRGIDVVPQSEFNVADAEETGLSFVENAIIKARHAATITGLPALADDSGLAVDALGGAPGIYSARYSGAGATDQSNNEKLLDALQATGVGALRGYKDTRIPMYIALFSYWVVGFPLECILGFGLLGEPMGVYGFWLGLAIGVGTAAILISIRLWRVSADAAFIRRRAEQ